jgi:hypothetical protein
VGSLVIQGTGASRVADSASDSNTPVLTVAGANQPATKSLSARIPDGVLGEENFTYTWSVLSKPDGAADPDFLPNGSHAAKNSVATFSSAGTYSLAVAIADGAASVATSSVIVNVDQSLTSIVVTPVNVNVSRNGTQQYAASGLDQFGQPLAVQPAFSWSKLSGPGAINATGLFSAGTTLGPFQVQAASGVVTGTANGTIINSAPTVATPATATPNPAAGVTTPLSVLGADDGGEANLTYTWSVESRPNGAADPTFSANGTNGAKNTSITVNKSGSYSLRVTISDGTLSVTSDVTLIIDFTLGQNDDLAADVNDSGVVDAFDILEFVTYFVAAGAGPSPVPAAVNPRYYDVNANGVVDAFDLLDIVTYYVAHPPTAGEGEFAGESTGGDVPVGPPLLDSEALLALLAADAETARRKRLA